MKDAWISNYRAAVIEREAMEQEVLGQEASAVYNATLETTGDADAASKARCDAECDEILARVVGI